METVSDRPTLLSIPVREYIAGCDQVRGVMPNNLISN